MGFISYMCEKHDIKLINLNNLPEDMKTQIGQDHGGGFVLKGSEIGSDIPHYLLYDGKKEWFELNFIVLHELGHILLGHTSEAGLNHKTKELEASVFSAAVLAQMCFKEYEASLKSNEKEDKK